MNGIEGAILLPCASAFLQGVSHSGRVLRSLAGPPASLLRSGEGEPARLLTRLEWRPQRESNPRYRLERPASWSTRRWGQIACGSLFQYTVERRLCEEEPWSRAHLTTEKCRTLSNTICVAFPSASAKISTNKMSVHGNTRTTGCRVWRTSCPAKV